MPRFELYSVDYANHELHMRLTSEETIARAWFMGDIVSNLTPSTAAVRVYEQGIPVLETRSGVTQFSIWHYEEES